MNKLLAGLFIAAFLYLVVYICFFAPPLMPENPPVIITGVVRIFMHDTGHYSVMVQNPETKAMSIQDLGRDYYAKIIFLPDAPNDKPMWVVCTYHPGQTCRLKSLEFHFRSEKDIEGTGWDYGKFGHGQTQVIN